MGRVVRVLYGVDVLAVGMPPILSDRPFPVAPFVGGEYEVQVRVGPGVLPEPRRFEQDEGVLLVERGAASCAHGDDAVKHDEAIAEINDLPGFHPIVAPRAEALAE